MRTIYRQRVSVDEDGMRLEVLEAPGLKPTATLQEPYLRGRARLMEDLESGWRPSSELADLHRQVGSKLHDAMFPSARRNDENIRKALQQARDSALARERPLTVQIRFDADAISQAQLPWELVFDDDHHLVLAEDIHINRYITYYGDRDGYDPVDVLHILYVIARPTDQAPLDHYYERDAMVAALKEHITQSKVRITVLEDSTFKSFQQEIRKGIYHIVHFDGHGTYSNEGLLAFETSKEKTERVSAQQFADALEGSGVRLVVLSACRSGMVKGQNIFNSFGPALIRAGIPSVVTMQYSIDMEATIDFAEEFYASLARGESVEAAVADGRRHMGDRWAAWFYPALYLRAAEGEGFFFAAEPIEHKVVRYKELNDLHYEWQTMTPAEREMYEEGPPQPDPDEAEDFWEEVQDMAMDMLEELWEELAENIAEELSDALADWLFGDDGGSGGDGFPPDGGPSDGGSGGGDAPVDQAPAESAQHQPEPAAQAETAPQPDPYQQQYQTPQYQMQGDECAAERQQLLMLYAQRIQQIQQQGEQQMGPLNQQIEEVQARAQKIMDAINKAMEENQKWDPEIQKHEEQIRKMQEKANEAMQKNNEQQEPINKAVEENQKLQKPIDEASEESRRLQEQYIQAYNEWFVFCEGINQQIHAWYAAHPGNYMLSPPEIVPLEQKKADHHARRVQPTYDRWMKHHTDVVTPLYERKQKHYEQTVQPLIDRKNEDYRQHVQPLYEQMGKYREQYLNPLYQKKQEHYQQHVMPHHTKHMQMSQEEMLPLQMQQNEFYQQHVYPQMQPIYQEQAMVYQMDCGQVRAKLQQMLSGG